jgi:hypothetical protein
LATRQLAITEVSHELYDQTSVREGMTVHLRPRKATVFPRSGS